jgi:hypothetical protein
MGLIFLMAVNPLRKNFQRHPRQPTDYCTDDSPSGATQSSANKG